MRLNVKFHATPWSGLSSIASVLLVCGAFFTAVASANDSTGHATPTGIEFLKNENVSIESEILNLGGDEVSVEYEFYNHSAEEVPALMAFPLPERSVLMPGYYDSLPDPWDFQVYVNGTKYESVTLQWRAIVNGTDKAKILQGLGISVGQPAVYERINGIPKKEIEQLLEKSGGGIDLTAFFSEKNALPGCLIHSLNEEDQEHLVREGLVTREGNACLLPDWRAQATFLWQVRFPPKKITKVRHRYHQKPGYFFCSQHHGDSNCLDGGPPAAREFGNQPVKYSFYEYVLHTGGNWKGPIKRFHFRAEGPQGSFATVEAPFPVKRVARNVLVADLSNYKPQSKEEYLLIKEKRGRLPGDERPASPEIEFLYAEKYVE